MTATELTIENLRAMNPCRDALAYAEKHKTLSTAWEKCERADWMIWYLRRKSLLDKPTAVKFAVLCAERVIGIYEKKYPGDDRPRKAIEAAKAWIANPSAKNKKAAAADAAAYAAAYAAYAAYAAAYAAYAAAAADAAAAAAYATTAADAAAYATTADAAYARAKERKWQADELRKLVKNPFTP